MTATTPVHKQPFSLPATIQYTRNHYSDPENIPYYQQPIHCTRNHANAMQCNAILILQLPPNGESNHSSLPAHVCPLQRVNKALRYRWKENKESKTKHEEKCNTFYDNQHETKYETQYEEECETKYKEQYETMYETPHEEKCETKYEAKYETKYKTLYEEECETQYDEQYETMYETQYDGKCKTKCEYQCETN